MSIRGGSHQSEPLYDSQRRLEAVLNNATVAIFLMNHRQHCIYMNKAAERLTGYTFDEVEKSDRPLHDIIHHTYPDGRSFPLCECAIDRAYPEHHQTQGEETFVHKDGSFYPVAFTASPIQDEESRTIGTIIEVRDIREEKAARDRQNMLLNELNHRVKNTLATVQSLARITFKDVDRATVSLFEGRLTNLSRAHDILTQASWEDASLAEVIRSALDPFEGIEQEGPDCATNPKMAVSLSMVLNELATNAVKYGALTSSQGRVSLSWTIEEGPQGAHLRLTWREDGGPPVTPPTHRGFGARLIQRQIAMEFGGRAELDFRPSGLVCTIQLPIPRRQLSPR